MRLRKLALLPALGALCLVAPADAATYRLTEWSLACQTCDSVTGGAPTLTVSGEITTTGKLGDLDLDQFVAVTVLGIDGNGVELFKSGWEVSDGPSPFFIEGDPAAIRLHATATALSVTFDPATAQGTSAGLDKSFGKVRISYGSILGLVELLNGSAIEYSALLTDEDSFVLASRSSPAAIPLPATGWLLLGALAALAAAGRRQRTP